MSRRSTSRSLLICLASILLLAVVVPSATAAPIKYDYYLEIDPWNIKWCSGVPHDPEAEYDPDDPDAYWIYEYGVVQGTITEHYDKNGNVIRHQAHVSYDVVYYNDTTGAKIEGHGRVNEEAHLQNGSYTISGLRLKMTLPGHGAVIMAAGKIIFNPDGTMEIHGRTRNADVQGSSILCSLLAPQ